MAPFSITLESGYSILLESGDILLIETPQSLDSATFTGAASSTRIATSSASDSAITAGTPHSFQDDPKSASDMFGFTVTVGVTSKRVVSALDSAAFTVAASRTRVATSSASDTFSFTATVGVTSKRVVSAHDSATFTGAASNTIFSGVVLAVAASDSATFTGASISGSGHNVSASTSFIIRGTATSGRGVNVSASDSFRAIETTGTTDTNVSDLATFTDTAAVITNLGRFRRGDWLPLAFVSLVPPDAIPVAVILDSNSTQVDIKMMPAVTPDGLTFLLPYQIGLLYGVGNFNVFYHYVVSGVSTLQSAAFEVIPGGDSGGAVISLYSIDRPEVRSIVAQLDSGVLVLGRSPTVKE